MADEITDLSELAPEGTYFTKPTTQLDLERRQALEEDPTHEDVPVDPADAAVEGNDLSGYAGVDPMYQNYANETEKPYASDGDDAESIATQRILETQPGMVQGEDLVDEDDDDTETPEPPTTPTSTPAAGSSANPGQTTTPSSTSTSSS